MAKPSQPGGLPPYRQDWKRQLLSLRPVEASSEVDTWFRMWRDALQTDDRFKGAGNRFRSGGKAEAEPDDQRLVEWRALLRPKGLRGGLDVDIKLVDKSASYTPLDRNNPGAVGVASDGCVYMLRQWYDTKRIGSKALKAEDLTRLGAPEWAELEFAASKGNVGRGRLYCVLSRLNDSPAEIAQQCFDAISAFHRVSEVAREEF